MDSKSGLRLGINGREYVVDASALRGIGYGFVVGSTALAVWAPEVLAVIGWLALVLVGALFVGAE